MAVAAMEVKEGEKGGRKRQKKIEAAEETKNTGSTPSAAGRGLTSVGALVVHRGGAEAASLLLGLGGLLLAARVGDLWQTLYFYIKDVHLTVFSLLCVYLLPRCLYFTSLKEAGAYQPTRDLAGSQFSALQSIMDATIVQCQPPPGTVVEGEDNAASQKGWRGGLVNGRLLIACSAVTCALLDLDHRCDFEVLF